MVARKKLQFYRGFFKKKPKTSKSGCKKRYNIVTSNIVTPMMTMMVYYCLSKRSPLLNTYTFTPVESELNTLIAALAAPKLRLAGKDP